jgi:ABC-type microcin C transport system permease subunit YejE
MTLELIILFAVIGAVVGFVIGYYGLGIEK